MLTLDWKPSESVLRLISEAIFNQTQPISLFHFKVMLQASLGLQPEPFSVHSVLLAWVPTGRFHNGDGGSCPGSWGAILGVPP